MALLTRLRQFAAKIESTYGTAETLAAADAVDRVMDPELAIVRNGILVDGEGFGPADVLTGDASVTAAFRLYCNGSGSGGAPAPAWFKYLQSAGMELATSTLTTTTDTTKWKGLTAALHRAGRRRRGRGIMGNAVFNFTSGRQVEMTYNGMGGYIENPTDTALLSNVTYNTTRAPTWAGTGSLTFGGSSTVKIRTLSLDLGNEVALREDPNSDGGYIGAWLGNRATRVTMDPEALAVATQCYYAAQSAGTALDLVLVAGTVAGNILTWTVNDLKVENAPTEGDRDGKVVDNLGLVATGSVTLVAS